MFDRTQGPRPREHRHRLGLVLAVAGALLGVSAGSAETPTLEAATELLARSDVSTAAPVSFRALLAIGTTGSSEPPRHVELWKGGDDHLLIRFLDPRERGKWLIQNGDDLVFVSPGASRPVRLGPGHRLWGRISLRELVGFRYAESYRVAAVEETGPDQLGLDLDATTEGLLYPSARYVVDRVRERPLRIELRLPSGKPARLLSFPEWEEGESLRPRRLILKDLLRGGPPVEVEFLELEPREIPEGLFDPDDARAREALPLP